MDAREGFERRLCRSWYDLCRDEADFNLLINDEISDLSFICAMGFEERSVEILRRAVGTSQHSASVALLRYRESVSSAFEAEYMKLADRLSRGNIRVFEIGDNDGLPKELISLADGSRLCVDISALTTVGIFSALDLLDADPRPAYIAYSEAKQYRPTKAEWDEVLQRATGQERDGILLADLVEREDWLYSGVQRVHLISGHEGYGSGAPLALLGFMPFKCTRLSAIVEAQEYSSRILIAGIPRLPANSWRRDALNAINSILIREGGTRVDECETFGYRKAFCRVEKMLLDPDDGVMSQFDVHIAPLGSKLQKVAMWAISSLLPSVTVISSVVDRYHPDGISHGAGESWFFKLVSPKKI